MDGYSIRPCDCTGGCTRLYHGETNLPLHGDRRLVELACERARANEGCVLAAARLRTIAGYLDGLSLQSPESRTEAEFAADLRGLAAWLDGDEARVVESRS